VIALIKSAGYDSLIRSVMAQTVGGNLAVRDQLVPDWSTRQNRQFFEVRDGDPSFVDIAADIILDDIELHDAEAFFGTPLGRRFGPAFSQTLERDLPEAPLSPARLELLGRVESALAYTKMTLAVSEMLSEVAVATEDLMRFPGAPSPDMQQARTNAMEQARINACSLSRPLPPGTQDHFIRTQLAERFKDFSDSELQSFLAYAETASGRAVFRQLARATCGAGFLGWKVSAPIAGRAVSAALPDRAASVSALPSPAELALPILPVELRGLDPDDPKIPAKYREAARQWAVHRSQAIDVDTLIARVDGAMSDRTTGDATFQALAKELRDALASRSDHVGLLVGNGNVLLMLATKELPAGTRRGRVDPSIAAEALKAFERAIAGEPGNSHALMGAGRARFLAGDLNGADALYSQAEMVASRRGSLLAFYLGDLAHERGDLETAIELHRVTLESTDATQRLRAAAFYALALGDARKQNWAMVAPTLERHIAANPQMAMERFWLGYAALWVAEEPEYARRLLEQIPDGERFGNADKALASAIVAQAHEISIAAGKLTPEAEGLVEAASRHFDLFAVAEALSKHKRWSRALATLFQTGLDVTEPYPHVGAAQNAMAAGNHEVIHDLLALGIDVNRPSSVPLLHLAIQLTQPELVSALLKRGADPRMRDGGGRNAWDLLEADNSDSGREMTGLLGPRTD